MFASASPIHDFQEDLFGYEAFARSIARGVVYRSNITEPYVIGVDAAWGMGKTSAANLIQRAFEGIARENMDDMLRVHVVNFSPWLVSSLDALAISYIGELTGALNTSFAHRLGPDWRRFRKKLLKRFGELLSVSAGVYSETLLPGLGAPTTVAGRTLLAVSEDSTEELGSKLRKMMVNVDAGQIVVIVDDVDRLHPDEMRHLLTLITTFGNLPRVVHLLLHDRNIVDRAMKRLGHGVEGSPTYLEKIIHLPTALPTVDPVRLRDFLVMRVRLSCNLQRPDDEGPLQLSAEDGIRAMWRDILRGILTTPREVTRLTNSLAATWPSISEHAELLDFIGIETLRLVRPNVWERLRSLRRILVGESDFAIAEGRVPGMEEMAAGESVHVRWLIERLFPLTSPNPQDHQEIIRRGQRAICSPNSVDVYFQFQPGGVVARSFLTNMLRDASPVEFSDRLVGLARDELRSLLNDLAGRPLRGVAHTPAELFLAVCNVGDRLIGRAATLPPALHDVEVFRDLDELLWGLLGQAHQDDREEIVRNAILLTPSIAITAIIWQRLVLRAGLRGYETSRPEVLIAPEGIDRLGQVLGQRLQGISHDPILENTPLLGWVLNIWRLTGIVDGLEDLTIRLTQSDSGLVNILDGAMGHAVSSDRGPYRSVRAAETIVHLTYEDLRRIAMEARGRDGFPIGEEDPVRAEIARDLLDAYIDGDALW